MRRLLLGIIAGIGCLLILAAGVLLIEQVLPEERRAELRGSMGETVTAFAEDERSGPRSVRRIKRLINDLSGGILFSTGFDMAQLFPKPPEGWVLRDYEPGDGYALTGMAMSSGFVVDLANRTDVWLRDISKAAKQFQLSRAVTFSNGTEYIVMWGQSELDDFRRLETGTPDEVARLLTPREWTQSNPAWRIDGIAFQAKHPILAHPDIQDAPKGFLYYEYAIGRIVNGGVMSNLAEEDLLAFLEGMDIAGLQAKLPQATFDFAPATARAATDTGLASGAGVTGG